MISMVVWANSPGSSSFRLWNHPSIPYRSLGEGIEQRGKVGAGAGLVLACLSSLRNNGSVRNLREVKIPDKKVPLPFFLSSSLAP